MTVKKLSSSGKERVCMTEKTPLATRDCHPNANGRAAEQEADSNREAS